MKVIAKNYLNLKLRRKHMNMLKKLARLIGNFPMKSVFITIIVVGLLAAGVINVYMATGNDTLVKTDTDVYQDNEMLEKEFGGESVIVLYESDDLLTPEHLKHMKGIEDALETNDSIYSMMSPVTLVEEIAEKQSNEFQDGIGEIIDGLDEMGGKLVGIGDELKANANSGMDMAFPEMGGLDLPEMEEPDLPEMEDPEPPQMGKLELPEMEGAELPEFDGLELPELELPEFDDVDASDMDKQMEELDQIFSSLTEAQKKLGEGTEGLVGGYDEFGDQLGNVGESLLIMTDQMPDNPQKDQLVETSQKLLGLSEEMLRIADESGELPEIPDSTSQALKNVQKNLNNQLEEQKQMVGKQKEMQKEMQVKQTKMQEEIQEEQKAQQEKMKQEMQEQEAEKEKMEQE